jgi:hypothetical protein
VIFVNLLKIGIVVAYYLTELLFRLLSQLRQLFLKPALDVIDDSVDSILAPVYLILHFY